MIGINKMEVILLNITIMLSKMVGRAEYTFY